MIVANNDSVVVPNKGDEIVAYKYGAVAPYKDPEIVNNVDNVVVPNEDDGIVDMEVTFRFYRNVVSSEPNCPSFCIYH